MVTRPFYAGAYRLEILSARSGYVRLRKSAYVRGVVAPTCCAGHAGE